MTLRASNCSVPSESARTRPTRWTPSEAASRLAPRYTVSNATVDNGRIDLTVDTTAHCIREQTTSQILGLCMTAGERIYPYGFKVPLFSSSDDVTFADDTHWSYTFEANITNAFGATAKRTPVTCTGTMNGRNIKVADNN